MHSYPAHSCVVCVTRPRRLVGQHCEWKHFEQFLPWPNVYSLLLMFSAIVLVNSVHVFFFFSFLTKERHQEILPGGSAELRQKYSGYFKTKLEYAQYENGLADCSRYWSLPVLITVSLCDLSFGCLERFFFQNISTVSRVHLPTRKYPRRFFGCCSGQLSLSLKARLCVGGSGNVMIRSLQLVYFVGLSL